MRSVFNVAVQDGTILRNPCKMPGAGAQRSPSDRSQRLPRSRTWWRPTTPCFKGALVLAAWCGFRRREECALRTEDVGLDKGLVHVRKNWVELLEEATRFEKDPKSNAGKRNVTVPPHVLPIRREHAENFAGDELLFVDRYGSTSAEQRRLPSLRAGEEAGRRDHHVPRLRHTGQSLAAATGSILVDLKQRLGHSSKAAAQRYMPP